MSTPWIPAVFPGGAVAPVDLAPAVRSGVAGLLAVEFFAAQLPNAQRWMTGFDPATPGYIKVYETDLPSEWTKKPVKVWDGSIWVIKPMKFPNQYGFYRPTS